MTDLPTSGGRWLLTKAGQLRRYPETETDEAEAPAPASANVPDKPAAAPAATDKNEGKS